MTVRYQHHDFVLARVTTTPDNINLPSGVDLDDLNFVAGQGREWLEKTWARPEVCEALAIASPDLTAYIDRLLADGTSANPRDLRRAVSSVASYLLRWERRPTPFGLFAGIVPVVTRTAASTPGHTSVRPDADWITAMIDRLEQDPELQTSLAVVTNNTAVTRDGRIFLTRDVDVSSGIPGTAREVSVRGTRPARFALQMAATPLRFADLLHQLSQSFPSAVPEAICSLLNGLIDAGFLITSLRPPMTASDPLAHVITELETAGAERHPVTHELRSIQALLRAHVDCSGREKAAELRATAASQMTRLVATGRYPLAVDMRLSGTGIAAPPRVLEEVAAAASVLLRLTTRPFGSMAWVEYHARFRERYGPGALVPVTELLSDSGLGYPDGYLNTRRARPAHRMLSERDTAMLRLVQTAIADGRDEIVLDDEVIKSLIIDDQSDLVPPQRVEIGVTVHAHSAKAIGRGNFELRVVSAPRVPTSMADRFAHLLRQEERDLLIATYQPGDDEDTIAVQLSFPPLVPHAGNVARVLPLLNHVVPIGEHPPAKDTSIIAVEDLAVTGDASQLYLVHRPTGRRVVPQIPHALELTTRTPPLARFLAQVADARTAGFGPFDPGAARVLPYLPRIRYRRTILSAARWLLTTADLAAEPTGWADRLSTWRKRWQVPARVIVCNGELRLPLDLDQKLDQSLLRVQLDRARKVGRAGKAGQLELREDAPPEGNGWLGKPAELLIPLTLVDPPPRKPPATAPPGKTHVPGASNIICVQLTGNPDRFSDLIATHLPRLAQTLAPLTERWWVRRYRDMIHPWSPQHVLFIARLTSPDAFAEAAAQVADFAAGLEALGLPGQISLVSYNEHPARYGADDAMTAAEHVFASDTLAAIAQIAMADSAGIPGRSLAAASMAQLAATFADTAADGYRALITILPRGTGPLDRNARDLACRLASPEDDFKALRIQPGGDAVADAWKHRDTKLAEYRVALLKKGHAPVTVLRTLLHEHHMRAVGLDPDTEKQAGRLARAAALQRLALTAGAR